MTAPDPAATLKALQLFQQAQQLRAARQLPAAADAFRRAMALLPNHPGIVLAYATLAEEVQDWQAAERLLRHAATLTTDGDLDGRLGQALFKLGRYAEAIAPLRTYVARRTTDADGWRMLGLALCKEKDWAAALAAGETLAALVPGEGAMEIRLNSLFNLGRADELDALVEQALAQFPDSALVLSLCAMHLQKRGDYRRGFAYPHQVRWRYEPGLSAHPCRVPANWWDGKPFAGTLLVSGEQGLGEEMLAASMFDELERLHRDHGQAVVVSCEPRLLPLFRRAFPGLTFVDRTAGDIARIAAGEPASRHINSLDLGFYFRRQTPLPPRQPWLLPDAARTAALRAQYRGDHPQQVLCGISWKSSRQYTGGPGKSVDLRDLAALLRLPAHHWFNAQYGDVTADFAGLAVAGITPPQVDAAIDPTADIDGLAAQLCAFDVLVTTSNTTAHLAGALGVRCHLLLPKVRPVLWYWGYDGERTPWYPSITIHRNRREDDWTELAGRVAQAIVNEAQR